MKEYLLLLRGGDAPHLDPVKTPEEWQKHMGEWKIWMGNLVADGKLSGGSPLAQTGRVIQGRSKVTTDGPFAEGKEMIAGYLMIKADNYNEVLELSMSCPGLANDSTIEIREVQAMEMKYEMEAK